MERMVGVAVKKIDNIISREIIKESKENSELILSPIQVRIIKFIIKSNNSGKEVFQRDVENKFEIRRSTTSGILNTMEKNNIIKRVVSHTDKRQNQIILTDYGKEIFLKIEKNINKFEKRIINGISDDELNTFFNVIDKIKYNLEGDKNV